jgi:hypothetical protein
MQMSRKGNQVTVCQGNTCLTVVGELAKALAVIIMIALAVQTAGQVAKLLR